MRFGRPPIWRAGPGRYIIAIGDQERAYLATLADELTELLANPDNPGLHRSFPPAYQGIEHLEQADEYRRLMTDELVDKHRDALATLAATTQAAELDEEQMQAWMRALNQLRLTLGTRLDVSDDSEYEHESLEGRIYEFLTALQDDVVQALSGR